MSGGHFGYTQYHIEDIADSIEKEIERATAPRPPKVYEPFVSIIKEEKLKGCTSQTYLRHNFKTLEEARKKFKNGYKLLEEKEKETVVQCVVTQEIYRIRESVSEEYADGGFYPDYTPETLQEFRNAIYQLRKAAIYAQRVDWLICGDDGEDSFHKRLKEDLEKLPKIEEML